MSIMALLVIISAWFYVYWKDYIPDHQYLVIGLIILYSFVDADTYTWFIQQVTPANGRSELGFDFLLLAIGYAIGWIIVVFLNGLRKLRPEWVGYLVAAVVISLTNSYFLRMNYITMFALAAVFVGFLIWYNYRIEHSKPNQNP